MEAKENTISPADLEYKIVLLGNSSSGKTLLFKKITSDTFKEYNISTIGIDKRTFKVKCDLEENDGKISTKIVEITLIDTAGQERFRSITINYVTGTDAAIIFYDITRKKTFNDIQSWIESIKNYSKIDINNYIILLLGEKLQYVESGVKSREVEGEDVIELCEKNKIEWGGEYSDDYSIEQLKNKIIEFVKIIYKKKGIKKLQDEKIKLESSKYKKKKNNSCL